MMSKKEGPVTTITTTRRQFTGLICSSGLLTLAGCGGGGSSAADTSTAIPRITLSPQSASVALGQTLTLTVEASGANLTYQWRRNSVALNGATSSSLQVTVSSADNGAKYTVVVSNSAGQVESTAAILTVKFSAGISLLAGGLGGRGLLEGKGTQARLNHLDKITVNKNGVVYFSYGACGKVSAQGDVSFLGDFPGGNTTRGMACDNKGDLYACVEHVIYKLVNGVFSPFAGQYPPSRTPGFLDGVGQSALLNSPATPAFDAQNNLYFIDLGNKVIRKVTPAGVVSTLAGTPANVTMTDGKGSAAGFLDPKKLLALNDGSLLVLDGTRWRKIQADGTVSTLAGNVPAITDVTGVDTNALYALLGSGVVQLTLDGSTLNVAGSQLEFGAVDGIKESARFDGPISLAMTPDGKLAVAEVGNGMIRQVDPASGQVSAWVGTAPHPGYVDSEGAQARFANMGASCVDPNGHMYVIDTLAKTLRKVTPAGTVSTLFTNFPSDGGVAVDANGYFYGVRKHAIIKVSPLGDQQVWAGQSDVRGYADGAGSTASFSKPMGLVFDAQGNLLVGDSPEEVRTLYFVFDFNFGSTIRKITPSGVVSTIAGITRYSVLTPNLPPDLTFIEPKALVTDTSGRIWVLDQAGVRRIDAQSSTPVWLMRDTRLSSMAYAVGSSGDVYVVRENVIIKLSADGTQTVVAGVDAPYHEGVQLGALPGNLGQITSITCGAANMLYACSENSVLRIQLA